MSIINIPEEPEIGHVEAETVDLEDNDDSPIRFDPERVVKSSSISFLKNLYASRLDGVASSFMENKLDENQRIIARTQIDGNIVVVAGPGTGKTRTIMGRFMYVGKMKLRGDITKILGLAFTINAANEYFGRFEKMLGPGCRKLLHISTIHSFCLKRVNEYRKEFGYKTIKPLKEKKFEDIVMSLKNEYHEKVMSDEDFSAGDILKNLPSDPFNLCALIREMEYQVEVLGTDKNFLKHDEYELYQMYKTVMEKKVKKKIKYVDFHTVLVEYWKLLRDKKIVEDSYEFCFVDEFQDLSDLMKKIVLEIFKTNTPENKRKIWMVAGDPFQDIFKFLRKSQYIIDDLKNEAHVEKFYLQRNHRSTKNIDLCLKKFMERRKYHHVDNSFEKFDNGESADAELSNEYEQTVFAVSCDDFKDQLFKAEKIALSHEGDGNVGIFSRESGSLTSLSSFLAESKRIKKFTLWKKGSKEREYDDVVLSPLWLTKGSQFGVVILLSCTEYDHPFCLPGKTTDDESQQNLFYEGMSRAENYLYFMTPSNMEGSPAYYNKLVRNTRISPYVSMLGDLVKYIKMGNEENAVIGKIRKLLRRKCDLSMNHSFGI